MTDFNKLAASLVELACGRALLTTDEYNAAIEAARILRAAGAADVGGLMAMVDAHGFANYREGFSDGTGKGAAVQDAPVKRAALESALRVALAPKPGFVMVPIEPTEAMLEAAHNGDREYTLRNFGDIMTVMQGPYDHWCAMIAASQAGAQEPKP